MLLIKLRGFLKFEQKYKFFCLAIGPFNLISSGDIFNKKVLKS